MARATGRQSVCEEDTRKALPRAILLSSRGVKRIPTIFCDFYETAFEIVSHPAQKFFLLSNSRDGASNHLPLCGVEAVKRNQSRRRMRATKPVTPKLK